MKSNFLIVSATILEVKSDKLQIKILDAKKDICANCKSRAGCKSLSVAPFLIKDKEINMPLPFGKSYQKGDCINLFFPSNFLTYSLVLIIGIPLVLFLLSVLTLSLFTSEIVAFLGGLIALFGSIFVIKIFFNKYFLSKIVKLTSLNTNS